MKKSRISRFLSLTAVVMMMLVSSISMNLNVGAFNLSGTDHSKDVVIKDWSISNGVDTLSDTVGAVALGKYGTNIKFEVTLESGTFAPGDYFTFPLFKNASAGVWQAGNNAADDFLDDSGEVIGEWKIVNGTVQVQLNQNVKGYQINGSVTTGNSALANSNVVDILQEVSIETPKSKLSKNILFLARPIKVLPREDVKYSSSPTNNSIRWNINVNNVGLHELHTSKPGDTFTIQNDTVLTDEIVNGSVENVRIFAYIYLPTDLISGKTSNIGRAFNINNLFTNVKPNAGESQEDFYNRLQPLQIGIYPKGSNSVAIVKFGDIGANGLKYDSIGGGNAIADTVNYGIDNNYYLESDRQALTDFLNEAYGNDNVISGHMAKFVVGVDAKYSKVIQDTKVSNTATLKLGNKVTNPSATETLQGVLGSGNVAQNTAMLFLEDQDSKQLLSGGEFSLQRQTNAGQWENVSGGTIVSTDTGTSTASLGLGTYRFIQTKVSSPLYDLKISNGFDAALGTVVSQTFVIAQGDTSGKVVIVQNAQKRYVVTYLPGTQGDFTPYVTPNIPSGQPTPSFSGDVDAQGNPLGKTGYEFTGWSPAVSSTVIEDATYTAQWSILRYTINFESNGGSAVNSETVDYNSVYTEPTDPTYTGHTFGGWYTDQALTQSYDFNTPATADITVYAKWDINKVTIDFESNGGSAVNSETVDYNTVYTEPTDPTYTGHTFGGWYTDQALTQNYDFSTPATADITVYAKWDINKVTIDFEANGGSAVSSEIVDYNSVYTEPTDPTYTGHTFGGWYTDQALTQSYEFNTPATADITVYAKWDINKVTIDFESNGGSAVDSETVDYNSVYTKPTDPTYTGFVFEGWYIDIELTQSYDFNTPATADITVYAKWDINKVTIDFESNGGSAVDSETVDYNSVYTKPTDPTYTGFVFEGWYIDNELTQSYDFNTPATADITVYAKWDLVSTDEEVETPTEPTKPNVKPSVPDIKPESPEILPETGVSNNYSGYVLLALGAVTIAVSKRNKYREEENSQG